LQNALYFYTNSFTVIPESRKQKASIVEKSQQSISLCFPIGITNFNKPGSVG